MKLVNYYYLLLLFGIVGCIAGVQQCYNDKEELITCDSTTGNAACFVDNNGKRGCANAGTATHTDNVCKKLKENCFCTNDGCNQYIASSAAAPPPTSKLNCYKSNNGDLGDFASCNGVCVIAVDDHTINYRNCEENVKPDTRLCKDLSTVVSENTECQCNTDKCNNMIGEKQHYCYVGYTGQCLELDSLRNVYFNLHGYDGLALTRCRNANWDNNEDESNICRKTTVTYESKVCNIHSCAEDDVLRECTNKGPSCGMEKSGDDKKTTYKGKLPTYDNREITIETTTCSGSKCNSAQDTKINLLFVLAFFYVLM